MAVDDAKVFAETTSEDIRLERLGYKQGMISPSEQSQLISC